MRGLKADIMCLLAHGGDQSAKNNAGQTPVDLANNVRRCYFLEGPQTSR